MPIYVYKCKQCRKSAEVQHMMKYVGNEKELPKETLDLITCTKHGLMSRVPQEPQLMGASEGEFKTEKQLLKEKQEQRKTRSRAHFKNEVLPTIKDPSSKKHFEKKFAKTKKIDHEKMK